MNLYWIVAKEEYSNVKDIELGYVKYSNELRIRGINFSFIELEDCIVSTHLDQGPILLYRNKPLDYSTSAFIISQANLNAQARSISLTLRNFLRIRRACLLNDPIAGSETLEWDKIGQMSLAEKIGAPILPFSTLGYHRQVIPSIQQFITQYPGDYIFKPVGTGMGFGVIKSITDQHAISIGNLISASSLEYFVMPFLPNACDVRFFFITQKLAFIKFRKPRGDSYIGNVSLGGEQVILTEEMFMENYSSTSYFHEMFKLSQQIMVHSGCKFLSVDWLMNDDGFYFNEMATAETGLSELSEETRKFVFDQIARIIGDNHEH